MEKFLEFLDSIDIDYEIQDGEVIVKKELNIEKLDIKELDVKHISIPENTDFSGGLDLGNYEGEVHLPENMRVALILYLRGAGVKRLPSNLTIYDDCSVYLDAHKIENVSYREGLFDKNKTIFAFWANNDFLISIGCSAWTYSTFAEFVDIFYVDNATDYKRRARDCISELAEKLGKTDPFKKATAK